MLQNTLTIVLSSGSGSRLISRPGEELIANFEGRTRRSIEDGARSSTSNVVDTYWSLGCGLR